MTPGIVAANIEQAVASTLNGVQGVAAVYILPKGETLSVFTIAEEEDEGLYDRIYDQERSLLRQFRGVHFDFNVIARRGRSIAEIVGPDVPVHQKRESPDPCLNVTNT
jgi:hypothetical protein